MSIFQRIAGVFINLTARASRWSRSTPTKTRPLVKATRLLALERMESRECPATLIDVGRGLVQKFQSDVASLVNVMTAAQNNRPTLASSTLRADLVRVAYYNYLGNVVQTLRELNTLGTHLFYEGYVCAYYRQPKANAALGNWNVVQRLNQVAIDKIWIAAWCNYVQSTYRLSMPTPVYYTVNAGLFSQPSGTISGTVQNYFSQQIQNKLTYGWNKTSQSGYVSYLSGLQKVTAAQANYIALTVPSVFGK